MDIKQEDLVRFWTWCGWKCGEEITKGFAFDKRWHWKSPTNIEYYKPPDLTLDSIYSHVIPKLQDKGYIVKLIACEQSGFVVQLESVILMERVWKEKSDTPTEALYNAIMKVIENEKENK